VTEGKVFLQMAEAKHYAGLDDVLRDWKAGRAIRSIELGHTQREIQVGINDAKRIDDSHHHRNRHDLAHAWVFKILDRVLAEKKPDMVYSEFAEICRELRETEMLEGDRRLTQDELNGAESLAWKAWLLGWDRAIRGHDESRYIQVVKD
jgi:hypothetical protein